MVAIAAGYAAIDKKSWTQESQPFTIRRVEPSESTRCIGRGGGENVWYPRSESRWFLFSFLRTTAGQSVQPGSISPQENSHTQKPSEADIHRASDTPDDVCFLRLPDVKAITGLSKTSIYDLIREKRFPAPGAAGTARRCLGQVRNQTVGRRACTRVAIGCLVRLGDSL